MSASSLKSDTIAEKTNTLDWLDRRLILLTQAGLPLTSRPFHAVAAELGVPAAEVMRRMEAMRDRGIIRRIAAVPNHYAVGYRANAMTVWDVDDDHISELGRAVGELDFVSHAYHRTRHPPDWPYNLFAMVHGRTRNDVKPLIERIRRLLGEHCRQHDVLYSTRILKKAGLRLLPKSHNGM